MAFRSLEHNDCWLTWMHSILIEPELIWGGWCVCFPLNWQGNSSVTSRNVHVACQCFLFFDNLVFILQCRHYGAWWSQTCHTGPRPIPSQLMSTASHFQRWARTSCHSQVPHNERAPTTRRQQQWSLISQDKPLTWHKGMSDSLTQKISPFSSSVYVKHGVRGIGAVAQISPTFRPEGASKAKYFSGGSETVSCWFADKNYFSEKEIELKGTLGEYGWSRQSQTKYALSQDHDRNI